jgi:hypothetical protein
VIQHAGQVGEDARVFTGVPRQDFANSLSHTISPRLRI